MRHINIFHYY